MALGGNDLRLRYRLGPTPQSPISVSSKLFIPSIQLTFVEEADGTQTSVATLQLPTLPTTLWNEVSQGMRKSNTIKIYSIDFCILISN